MLVQSPVELCITVSCEQDVSQFNIAFDYFLMSIFLSNKIMP
jgi:hypothetical protein